MSFTSTIAAAGAALGLALLSSGAIAADMPGDYPPPLPAPAKPKAVVFDSFGYGWYLRGDLGYRIGALSGAESAPGFPDPTDNHIHGAVFGGVGVGAKSRWLRTDLTIDYSGIQNYRGTITTPDDTTAKIQTFTALFNGYIDMGSWYTLTPYIGAGAGAARLRTSEYSSTGAPPFTTVDPNNQWNFAWALMAGVAWQVAPNLQLDFGYRWLNLGDVKTRADAFGAMTFHHVQGHEIRAGLRWSFDDLRIAN